MPLPKVRRGGKGKAQSCGWWGGAHDKPGAAVHAELDFPLDERFKASRVACRKTAARAVRCVRQPGGTPATHHEGQHGPDEAVE